MNYDDRRLKVFKPIKKLTPQNNLLYTFARSSGEFIFFIGGDDYFADKILDSIIPRLLGDKIFLGKFVTFFDKTKSNLAICNELSSVEKYFFTDKSFIVNLLKYINHDEVIYSFIPRHYWEKFRYLSRNPFESFVIWFAFVTFSKKSLNKDVLFINKIVYYKRYEKIYDSGNFARDAYDGMWSSLFTVKSLCSIANSVIFLILTFDVIHFLKLLLWNRSIECGQNTRGGFMGRGRYGVRRWYFGPLPMLFVSPFIDIFKLVKRYNNILPINRTLFINK